MKKSSKRLIAGAVVLLVAAGFVFKLVSGKEEAPQYETRPTVAVQTPVTGDITLYTELTGTVEPVSRASVMPKISGEILEVNFQAGDTVQAGQVLCKIDSDALRTMELQMQSASVAADTAARELARLSLCLTADLFPSSSSSRLRMRPPAPVWLMKRQKPSMTFRWNIPQ